MLGVANCGEGGEDGAACEEGASSEGGAACEKGASSDADEPNADVDAGPGTARGTATSGDGRQAESQGGLRIRKGRRLT